MRVAKREPAEFGANAWQGIVFGSGGESNCCNRRGLQPNWCMLLRFMGSVTVLVKFFGLAFSALLPLINPLGSALLFLSLVGNAPESFLLSLARKIAIRTTLFLTIVELVGTALLAFFGISLPVVQVAGGLVLATMGWSLLNQQGAQTSPDKTEAAENALGSLEQQVLRSHFR